MSPWTLISSKSQRAGAGGVEPRGTMLLSQPEDLLHRVDAIHRAVVEETVDEGDRRGAQLDRFSPGGYRIAIESLHLLRRQVIPLRHALAAA